ncbi:MAG: hypothetical protein NVS9B10_06210 [Nevskia sp.]
MELVIALLALVVSAATGVWTIRNSREQVEAMRLANVANIVDVERMLASVPSALRFHGVTPADLEAAGVTAAELAYLLSSCSATSLYHNNSREDPQRPFAPGSYRHGMCATEDFRRAWPLLKRLMNPGVFVSRIEATLAMIESRPAA